MAYRKKPFYTKTFKGPLFFDEISSSPGELFLNFNPADKNEVMVFLDKIKDRYSKKYDGEINADDVLENFVLLMGRFIPEYLSSVSDDSQKYIYNVDYKNFFYSFCFLKIIDESSNFYKKNCINSSFDDNSNRSYEYLSSVYNNSKWNLKELISAHIIFEDIEDINKILASKLAEYVGEFNKYFQFILDGFNFFNCVDFLKDNNLLLNFIVGLYVVDLNERIFEDSISFKKFYSVFHEKSIIPPYSDDSMYDLDFLPDLLFSNIDLKNRTQISIFDPACLVGNSLISCAEYIENINPECNIKLYGCCNDSFDYSLCLAKMLFMNQKLENFLLVENFNTEHSLKLFRNASFDFVISDLGRQENINFSAFDILLFKGGFSQTNLFNEKSVINTSFLHLSSMMGIGANIEWVDSLIHLPLSSESNRDGILILNRQKDKKRKKHVLLIDEFDKNIVYEAYNLPKKIIKNILISYGRFKNYKNGKIFPQSEAKNFNFQSLMYEKNVDYIDTDVPIVKLNELCVESNSLHDLIICTDLKNSADKIAYFNIPDDTSSYIEISLKPTILKEYLYYYLNSNKSINDLSYLTMDFKDMNGIYFLPVPVPSIDEQTKIVDAARKMEGFFNAMDIWKNNYSNNILNYKNSLKSYEDFSCTIEFSDNGRIEMCSHWKIVYQGLILPLAAAYLKATMGSNNDDIRKKNYLVLFEFMASFNVIVLISAIKNNPSIVDYDRIMKILWRLRSFKDKSGNIIYDYTTWHRMSFGSWTTLYGNLNKIFKNYNFSTVLDKEFFKTLSSKKYKKLFNKLRHKERNADAHGGFENDIDVTLKVQELQKYMDEDIFDILRTYSGLKLYYTTGENKQVSPKKIRYDVISLNGPCNPPMKSKIVTSIKLNADSLYLHDSLNNDFLELDKDLIRFRRIPNSEQYGFYIYDSIDTNENVALYKCYYDKEPWKIPLETDEDSFLNVSSEFLDQVLRI